MADMSKSVNAAGQELQKMTVCCICMREFTDPRMLPCVHTFCLHCLRQMAESANRRPRQSMPCPLCRKDFVIPAQGMASLQKNFFMQHLLEVTTALQQGQSPIADCDMCKALHEGDKEKTKAATMRCLQCEENFCDTCTKTHKLHKLSRNHKVVKIGANADPDVRGFLSARNCGDHNQKPLDYYCIGCKKEVCISCLHASHASHGYEKLGAMEEELRETIEENSSKMSSYAAGVLLKAEILEQRKAEFLHKVEQIGSDIQRRKQELLEMVDEHTKSLQEELNIIKVSRIKKFEIEKKEIEQFHTILKSFEVYSTELHSKGSSGDIGSCVDAMQKRANDLEKDHDTFLGRPCVSAEISFEVTDLEIEKIANSNILGQIKGAASYYENNLVMVGLSTNLWSIKEDVLKINLHRPNQVSHLPNLPRVMFSEVAAAVHDNTMYVTGIGFNWNEIFKYNSSSGWMYCTTLVQARRRHCAAFLAGVLYVCGGFYDSVVNKVLQMFNRNADGTGVLDSIETYNVVTNSCTTVGRLLHGINSSGNCVPYKSSLYIFGGKDKFNAAVSDVQVFNTEQRTCTLLSKPMPRGYHMMRAAAWDTSVVLLGCDTCFLYNFETKTWQERRQFKTDALHFSLALENDRVFVVGGGIEEKEKDGRVKWKCRGDVRYVPIQSIFDDKPIEWKLNATLSERTMVHGYAVMKEFLELDESRRPQSNVIF